MGTKKPRDSGAGWGLSCLVLGYGVAITLAGAACDGSIMEPEGTPEDLPAAAAQPAVMMRLTEAQYRNAVGDLLGPGMPRVALEPDTYPYLYANIGAASTTLSEGGAQQYEEAALALSGALFADSTRREAFVGCAPASADDTCVRSFVARFGLRAYRRPLDLDETERWAGVARDLSEGDPWQGLRYVVAGMLQSPAFLYRIEVGEPDPSAESRRRYTSYEMASRLSFLFWNTTPDDELLDAAARGDLTDTAALRAEAERLASDDRARPAVHAFFAQYLDLVRLDRVDRDPARYPQWSATMGRSMRTEVELLVDDLVFRREADVRELFSTRRTFVNAELAALYGIEAPGASPIAFVPVDLPADGQRAGVLGLGAFLTMNAHQTETSPTLRGKYLRERVLCQPVPPPPPDVITDLTPEDERPRTLRERLEEHRRNPVCASCHTFMDPPGMLFEEFDSIGAARTHEALTGLPINSTGDFEGTPLDGARDLAEILRTDPRVPRCMVRQLFRHASGRLERSGDERALRAVENEFAESGYRFRELMVALAASDAFRTLAPAEGATP